MATHRFRAPTKITTSQQALDNTFSFLLGLMGGMQVLNTAMYLIIFTYVSWLG